MSEQQRWRVEKRDRWIAGEFWTAFQGEKAWFDPTPMFDTWVEAMRYAEEQARTITVTLPTPKAVHTIPAAVPDEHSIHVRTEGQLTEISAVASQGLMRINLYHDELEPVALALLAHARGRA